MIFGIGVDLVEIHRFEAQKNLLQLATKILHPEELIQFEISHSKASYTLAKKWAIKEALVKALGTGFRKPFHAKNFIVSADEKGKPRISYREDSASLIEDLGIKKSHVSLSDTASHVIAFVILEI